MQDGRDRYYPEITQNLVEFVDKAFDLQRALQNITAFAFDNASALQNMYNAVTDYNHVRNTLSTQRFNYEKFIFSPHNSAELFLPIFCDILNSKNCKKYCMQSINNSSI